MRRVAFIRIGGHPWTGGLNYLLNLLDVLSKFGADRVQPVVFTGPDCPSSEIAALSEFNNVKIVQTERFSSAPHRFNMACSLILGRDPGVAQLFRRHDIDVVFEAAQFFGWRLRTPAIGWISDFQHKELPEMFSPLYRWRRSLGHSLQIRSGRVIMVSSDDARRTCERLYPSALGRAHTVNFAIMPHKPPVLDDAKAVAKSYGLTSPFYFMPNQFWRHKNHLLVIEALAILRRKGRGVVVAASGQQIDPISSGHFERVKNKLNELNLQDGFRILGLIPRDHIPALMRTCKALLNPSLFEGWSTTVEEAKALGTPMILSDLEVHREQVGANAVYFDRYSAQDLAEQLDNFLTAEEQQRTLAVTNAEEHAFKRAHVFAERFVWLVNLAASKRNAA